MRWLSVAILMFSLRGFAQQDAAPPGKLVDVHGTRLHIYCTGKARGPSVILISGIGDYSFDWALVQQKLQSSAYVCSYDRAGMAWSSADPAEANLHHDGQQLWELLREAKVPAPYVLVGHSWGGAIARVAAALSPRDVAGMVLVDSTHEDEILQINDMAVRPRLASDQQWKNLWRPMPGAPGGPLSGAPSGPPSGAPSGPPSGAMTIKRHSRSLEPPYTRLPQVAQQYRLWAISQPQHMVPGDLRADMTTLFATRKGKEHPLGELPLVVIIATQEKYEAAPPFTASQLANDHLRLQKDLVKLSTKSKQVFAKASGHHVQLDEPEVVVSAVEDVLLQVGQSKAATAASHRKN